MPVCNHYRVAVAACVLVATATSATPAQEPGRIRLGGNVITVDCQVTLIEQSQVAAFEAGVLQSLEARRGLEVQAGQELGRLDDELQRLAVKHAQHNLQVARESASDINLRYTQAAVKVAREELAEAHLANSKVADTVPKSEIRRRQLRVEQATLQAENAQRELTIAGVTVKTREAELATATENLNRRRIVAPIEGTVVDVYRHVGESVAPGDAVVRIVRTDRLGVEGFLNAGEFDQDITGCPITVTATLAGGRREEFFGKITFVGREVEPVNGEYRVYAEVLNRGELLRPGMNARLSIHLAPRTASKR